MERTARFAIAASTVFFALSCAQEPYRNETNVKPLIDPFQLIGKSLAEVELILGKPTYSEIRYAEYNEEIRHYAVPGIHELQIDYSHGRAFGIWVELDDEHRSRNAEDVAAACGFRLKLSNAEPNKLGYSWKDPVDAKPFRRVEIMKFSDSGIFYQCHANTHYGSKQRDADPAVNRSP